MCACTELNIPLARRCAAAATPGTAFLLLPGVFVSLALARPPQGRAMGLECTPRGHQEHQGRRCCVIIRIAGPPPPVQDIDTGKMPNITIRRWHV